MQKPHNNKIISLFFTKIAGQLQRQYAVLTINCHMSPSSG